MPYLISIATLVAGIMFWFSAPLLMHKTTPAIQESAASSTLPTTSTSTDRKQETRVSPKSENIKALDNIVVPAVVTQQSENIELKIAKCKADKQSSYDDAIAKLNKTTDSREQEVFGSLTQQYKDAVSKIYSSRDSNVVRITNDTTLTGSSKLTLITQYNDNADRQIEDSYKSQQAYWLKQKADIETAKQQAIDNVNSLLSNEYSICLEK